MGILTAHVTRQGFLPAPPPVAIGPGFTPAVTAIMIDDGEEAPEYPENNPTRYNGFTHGVDLSNGGIAGFVKKAYQHAPMGFFEMFLSMDGGENQIHRHITVDNEVIHTPAIAVTKIDGRIHIAWQGAENPAPVRHIDDYKNIKTAWIDEEDLIADFMGCTFISSTVINFEYEGVETWELLASFYGRHIKRPNGDIWMPIYTLTVDATAYPTLSQHESSNTYIKSTDNGLSWALATVPIHVGNGGAFPNGYTSECPIYEIPGYGVVCIARNESYGFYTHIRTEDEGATWTVHPTKLFYAFGSASGERRPVDMTDWNDLMRVGCGVRALLIDNSTPDYHFKYLECTPEVLWNNTGYDGVGATQDQKDENPTVVTIPYEVQAATYSSGIHWGYPMWMKRIYAEYGIKELLIHAYDASYLNEEPDDVRVTAIQIVVENSENTFPDPLP